MTKKKQKRLIWGTMLFLLVVAVSVCVLRWQAWFGMPPEPPFTVGKGIHRVLVSAGEEAFRDRVITWVSGDSVEMTFSISGDTVPVTPKKVVTDGGVTFVYRQEISGLMPGLYPYAISDGRETQIDTLRLKGETNSELLLYIGDIQDREKGQTRDFLHSVSEHYPEADGWLFAGDLMERGHDAYWETFYDAVQDFAPHTAFVPAIGNHEYSKGLSKRPDARWVEEFPKPANFPDPGTCNYFVDYRFARVIVLDTNSLPFGIIRLSRWLRDVLTEREDNPFLIVVMHHGVYSMASGRINLAERLVLGSLFSHYGVDLVLQGHDHVYARVKKENESKPLYLTSTTSLKSYNVKTDPSLLDKSADNGRFYVVLSLYDKKLEGTTFSEDHTPFDHFILTNRK